MSADMETEAPAHDAAAGADAATIAAVADILAPGWETVAAHAQRCAIAQRRRLPALAPECAAFAVRDGKGWKIHGVFRDTGYSKHTAAAPDAPDSPDDPIEAARWLDRHARLRAAGLHALAAEPFGERAARFFQAVADARATLNAQAPQPDSTQEPEPAPSHTPAAEREPAAVQGWADADFSPVEGGDMVAAQAKPAEAEESGDVSGVAYFSDDLDTLVRAKLGRLGQIARARKTALQDGWTLEEFRGLQNLIQRIERGEASNDHNARARFFAISERSRLMANVDAYRDARESALDALGAAKDRDGVRAFDPEAGWPEPEAAQ